MAGSDAGDQQASGQQAGSGRRRWPVVAAIVLVPLGLAAAWAAWIGVTGARAYDASRELQGSIDRARAAAATLDLAAAAAELPRARESSQRILDLTSGPAWWIAARLPYLGTSVTSARSLAQSALEVTTAAAPFEDLLVSFEETGLRTADGGIDLAALDQASATIQSVADATARTQARLDAIDADGLPGPLATPIGQARDQLPGLAGALSGAGQAIERLGGFLGADRPRTWLVLLQNNAEIRGTGGFVGAYAIVRADRGRVTIAKTASNDELVGSPIPYEQVADESTVMTWGADLGSWPDFNLSPHFPTTGALAAAGMADLGTPVDGVVAIDQGFVAALLAGTGPVTAKGVTIDAGNAVDYLSRRIYADYPDPANKDAVVLGLFRATLQKALGEPLDVPGLVTALRPVVETRRLQAWSSDGQEQAWLARLPAGGVLGERPGSLVAVALANSAGNKLDAYLTADYSYAPGNCAAEASQVSRLGIELEVDAPEGLPAYASSRLDAVGQPYASTALIVAVYGPLLSSLLEATQDGEPLAVSVTEERGRPVWKARVELRNHEPVRLAFDFTDSMRRPGGAAPLRVTPMVIDPTITVTPTCS